MIKPSSLKFLSVFLITNCGGVSPKKELTEKPIEQLNLVSESPLVKKRVFGIFFQGKEDLWLKRVFLKDDAQLDPEKDEDYAHIEILCLQKADWKDLHALWRFPYLKIVIVREPGSQIEIKKKHPFLVIRSTDIFDILLLQAHLYQDVEIEELRHAQGRLVPVFSKGVDPRQPIVGWGFQKDIDDLTMDMIQWPLREEEKK